MNDLGWHLVLRVPSSMARTHRQGAEETCVIVGVPDPFSSHCEVVMVPGNERRSIHVPWADRPEAFASLLAHCADTTRIYATVGGGVVSSYSLYVHAQQAERQWEDEGCLRGEPFVAAALQRFVPECVLPTRVQLADEIDGLPVMPVRPLRCTWSLPLKDAQRVSVDWLQMVERAVALSTNQMCYDSCIRLSDTIGYDPGLSALRTTHDTESSLVRYRGCVLANDVGTGKTCCVLRLIAEEAPLDGASPRYDPLYQGEKDGLTSAATVVVCPLGVQQHWRDEAAKFAPDLRVVVVSSVREMRAVTLQTLLECDLVLTTASWLRSRQNTEATDELVARAIGLGGSDATTSSRLVRKSVLPAARAILRRGTADQSPAALTLVRFRRCVVDEAHDVLGPSAAQRERLRACRLLRAGVWIGLTATPNVASAAGLQEWNGLLLSCGPDDACLQHPCLSETVARRLIRSFATAPRNAYHVLHRVSLSALERGLLESYHGALDVARTVQVCSSAAAHVAGRRGAQSVSSVFDSLATARSDRLAELVEEARAGGVRAAAARRQADEVRRDLGFLDRMAEQLRRDDATCPVCFETPDRRTPWAVLGCGHATCAVCYSRLVDRACPMCRAPIERAVFAAVSEPRLMRESRGSKLEAIVRLLTQTPPASSIVVSAWKPFLSEIRETLAEAGVATETLEGSSVRRAAALRRFREAPDATLLVHTRCGFAGVDMGTATRIVFAHALTEPADEATRIEHQILGRVVRSDGLESHPSTPVTVHHYVAADTPEEYLWRSRHSTVALQAIDNEAWDPAGDDPRE